MRGNPRAKGKSKILEAHRIAARELLAFRDGWEARRKLKPYQFLKALKAFKLKPPTGER